MEWLTNAPLMNPVIRIPIIVHGPQATGGKTIEQQVLTVDIAPSILDICNDYTSSEYSGRFLRKLINEGDNGWRTAWFYEYNYEKQFPYTPNVRALRTDRWKYIRYPHGDGSPDKHIAEMYDIKTDPNELHNFDS